MARTCMQKRGRQITTQTMRMLFAESAGFCQKPECNRDLFVETYTGNYVAVGEMAHILAASLGGPRPDRGAESETLASIENLILLCKICHAMIDLDAQRFPEDLVRTWKREHNARRTAIFGTKVYKSRPQLRRALEPLLQHSRAVFESYGPESLVAQDDPTSDAVDLWHREIIHSLIPNNRKTLDLLEKNRDLLTEPEQNAVAKFRVHVDAFEARHLFHEIVASNPTFPIEINEVAKD